MGRVGKRAGAGACGPLWLLVLGLSMLSWLAASTPAQAQGRSLGGGGGGLGDLLNALVGSGGVGGSGGRTLRGLVGPQTSPVDTARTSARNRRAQSGADQPAGPDLATAAIFTPAERLLIQQFCTGEITEDNERTLELIDEFSRLERDNCRRAREVLFQFGYDAFANLPSRDLLSGTLPDDYRLGIGDEIALTYVGQNYRSGTVNVDREGKLVLPELPPIPAAGRRFGEVKREVEQRGRQVLPGTEIYISVATTRLLNVTVVGEVRLAGVQQLSSLSTVLDALVLAGGVRKTGSLRRIQVQRGDQVMWFDLYELVSLAAGGQDLQVQEGDRIIVPPLGPTVTIGGQVKRPGIYELPEGRRSISMNQLVALGGGTLRPRGNKYFHISFDPNGRERVFERADTTATVQEGDVVIVRSLENIQTGTAELVGYVRVPGRRSLAAAPTIRAMLQDASSLKDGAYLPFAVLETAEPGTEARRFFPVDLQRVFEGKQDYQLRDRDKLIVLSADDIAYLNSFDVQNVISPAIQRAQRDRLARQDEQQRAQSRQGGGGGASSLLGGSAAQGAAAALGAPLGSLASGAASGGDTSSRDALLQSFLRGSVPGGAGNAATGTGQAGTQDLQSLAAGASQLLGGATTGTGPQQPCAGLKALSTLVANGDTARFYNAARTVFTDQDLSVLTRSTCPKIFTDMGTLLPFALENVVAVNGEVRRPGPYPATPETPLASIIAVAGGLTREVDLTSVEITRSNPDPYKGGSANLRRVVMNFAKDDLRVTTIGPGDAVRFNAVFADRDAGPVVLSGEFVRPGLYSIRRGEKLSELITRAGGLTDQSYPYGATFIRERVKREQQAGIDRAARDLNSSLAVTATQRGVDPRAVLGLQDLSERMRSLEASGRVVIEADPAVLQVRPELDTVLEAGDQITMPKRPNFVSVIGDVLNPGAMQFVSGATPDRYIRQAGGFQRSADDGRIFVVFPNGAAQPIKVGVWNYTPVQIPPGSTLVVPKDPLPFDLFNVTTQVADLLSKVGIAAASLAVINR